MNINSGHRHDDHLVTGVHMKSKAAILWETNKPWSVEEIELDDPKAGEVLVEMKASGMCHSDEHLMTGDLPFALPIIGGHEGAGIVRKVGEGVSWLAPGDHVVFGFIPSCGRCPSCSTGHQNLCDLGALMGGGRQITDGGSRHHARGQELGLMCLLGTFAHHTVVNEASCIKVDDDLPFDKVCLLGCGVVTGWGSAVYAAEVKPGDTVAVVGVGGIGANAIQGARLAGAKRIIAIDPIEFKREKAMEFGATHTFPSMADAMMSVMEMTYGQMADRVIMTPGVLHGEMMGEAMNLAGKGSTVVVTAISPMTSETANINLFNLAMWNKEIKGTIFGSLNPRADIPALLDMYRAGQLKLDELITKTYKLEDINEGYEAMRDGTNLRGVIVNA